MSWTHGSEWMYVGTDSSYVYVVHTESFKLSGYSIRWIKTRDVYVSLVSCQIVATPLTDRLLLPHMMQLSTGQTW